MPPPPPGSTEAGAPVWSTPPPGGPGPVAGGVPPPPGPAQGGLSGGAIAALAGVVVVALVAVGAGVFFVTMAGDDDGAAADTRPEVPSTSQPESTSPPGEPGGTTDTSEPGSPETTEGPSLSLPLPPTDGAGSTDFRPPSELPRPPGATDEPLTGGIEVPGSADDAVAFYEGALPEAGYTISRIELAGVQALTVSGEGLEGQLVFVDIGFGTTTVLWQPS